MPIRPLPLLLLAVAVPSQEWTALDGPRFLDRFSAYDTHRNRLVTFSGGGETFEYDGNRLLHRPILGGAAVPPPRYRASMIYDEQRRHVLMFGGRNNNAAGAIGGTWAFDGSGWRQLTAGPQPQARSEPGFAYDSLRGRTVMLGGQFFSSTTDPDTWEHDGSQWQSRGSFATVYAGVMAFDRARGVTVMYQGSGMLGAQGATWEWNGLVWLQRTTATAPTVNSNQSMAYDPVRGRIVMIGGANNGEGIWEWNGNAWAQVATLTQPRRMDPALWFDPALGKLVVAGGTDVTISGTTTMQGSARTDVWTWDGATMALLRSDHRPPSRHSHMFFADLIRERLVLFGGARAQGGVNETWLWDGNSWTESPTINRPPPRNDAAITFDWTRGLGLLFGGFFSGQLLGDLWSWNGTDWTMLTSSGGPSPRSSAGMSYDITRDVTVLFGGLAGSLFTPGTLRNDTWEWTGAAWLPRTTSPSPSPREGAAMTFDLARNRTVLYGGRVGATAADQLGDLWEWNGATWQQVVLPGGPPALLTPSLNYDLARLRVVLTGTQIVANVGTFHVWEYDGVAWTQVWSQLGSPIIGPCALLPSSSRISCVPSAALHEFSATRAAVDVVGTGCGAPELALQARTRPRLGDAECGLDCLATPGQATVFGLAFTTAATALGNGCTLWLGQPATSLFTVAGPSGLAALALPIPRVYALRGLPVFAQAGVLDAASPVGVRLSPGLRLQVGD